MCSAWWCTDELQERFCISRSTQQHGLCRASEAEKLSFVGDIEPLAALVKGVWTLFLPNKLCACSASAMLCLA